MKIKHLPILFSLALGLGLTLAFTPVGQDILISAVPVAAKARTGSTTATAAELHVCPSGCTYSSVQAAVDAAEEGAIVKVAAGTYTHLNSYGGQAQAVYIDKTVTIQGGYTTTNWTTSDPDANPTTLDAHGEGRVIYITGNVSPTIEGLRITRGNAGQPNPDDRHQGAGIYVVTATATIRNNQIVDNHAYQGGGLYLKASASTLSENTVASCSAAGIGGGVYLDHSDALIAGNVISDSIGSGLYLDSSDATLVGNTISHNNCVYGGGLILYQSDSTLSQNVIVSNFAQMYGGGIFADQSSVTLTNNVIADNQVGDYSGSGLYTSGSHLYLRHTTIARNAGGDGSGVYAAASGHTNSQVVMTNTILVSHIVGLHAYGGSTAHLNGVLWYDTPTPTLGTGVTVQNQYTGDPAFAPDGYHITSASAAIDAGVDAGVTGDIDGSPRPWNAAPDLGADEIFLNTIYLPQVMKNWHSPTLAFLSEIREPLPSWSTGGDPAVAENRLFIPLNTRGLAIYDISDPLSPRLLARLNVAELGGQAREVAASKDRAFVSLWDKGTIAMVDLSDPMQPKVVGTFGYIPNVGRLELQGDLLYVQANSGYYNGVYYPGGVHVFDSHPRTPINVGSYLQDLTDPGFYVTDEGTVFIARTPGWSGDFPKIDVVDMSDPANPDLIGQWIASYPGNIVDIDMAGNRLFAAAYWGGLWILDAADPANMAQVAFYDWENAQPYAFSIAASPPFVFLAQRGSEPSQNKLDVFRHEVEKVVMDQKILMDDLPACILLDGNLLILQEYAKDEEIIKLYQITASPAGSAH